MDDGEVVAANAAGGQAGLAVVYDRYAAPLYGYCRWMLRDSAAAADALQDTFIVAAANIGGLDDPGQLRSWLYGVARDECGRRQGAAGTGLDHVGGEAGEPANTSQAAQRAELRGLISVIVAAMKPEEREAIELSVRHGLDDSELAAVLQMSWSRAHALSSHARGQLERTLGALLVARTGRRACSALDALLADWDGRLTVPTADLVSRHIDECQICSGHKHGGLRREVLAGLLLPLAALPLGLHEQVLSHAPATRSRRRSRRGWS